MIDFELDLTGGDPDAAAAAESTSKTKRSGSGDRNRGGSGSGSKKGGDGGSDSNLVDRLDGAFTKLAEQFEAREDYELAEAIREDKAAISKGLVSLTRTVTFLRNPLIFLVNVLEPIFACWHVGRILGRRFIERRQRIAAEREGARMAAMSPDEYAAYVAQQEGVEP